MPISDIFFGEPDPWIQGNDPVAVQPVWLRPTRPNSKQRFGALPRLAAYIAAHFDEGDLVTLKQLAANVPDYDNLLSGKSEPNSATQFQRRFRELREYGWIIQNYLDDKRLAPEEYRLKKIGEPIWLLGRPRRSGARVSPRVVDAVFERDGNRCVLCGHGAGEYYDDGNPVKLRAGHRRPTARYGRPTEDNLRTECARCNDAIRDERFDPVTLDELWPSIRRQPTLEKARLREWLHAGQKTRTEMERIYDRARYLSPSERAELVRRLG